MVQMVFVHGVSVRKDDNYQPALEARDRRFTTAFGGTVAIQNPYWGQFGASPLMCIPDFNTNFEALGGEQIPEDFMVEQARQDFPALVAALSVAALEDAQERGDAAALHDAEVFWAGAAAYAELQPRPGWLATIRTNQEFYDKLREEGAAMANVGLGLFDPIKAAADKLVGGLSNLVNSPFGKIGREFLSPKVAIFIGDVFRYLKSGQSRGDIRMVVTNAIDEAANAAKTKQEPLILAAHSMGGVILYDCLSDPAWLGDFQQRNGFPIKVDLLVTIGSQVAVFEEMRVYEASNPQQQGKTAKPACVALWWNVFDKMDVLSFLTEPAFNDVHDFAVDTTAGVLDAHGAYFFNAMFYERLNKRAKAAQIIP